MHSPPLSDVALATLHHCGSRPTQHQVLRLPCAESTHFKRWRISKINDIHYAYGKISIPLMLKQGRQSIAYPYKGGSKLTLFHPGATDQPESREVLCSVGIPNAAKYGILVLMQGKDNKYKCSAHWFENDDLKGSGQFLNLSGQKIALRFKDSKKPLVIAHKKKARLPFAINKDYMSVLTEGYISRSTSKGPKPQKIFRKNFNFQKESSVLVIFTQQRKHAFKALSLNAKGVNNLAALHELRKFIPGYMKPKTPPVTSASAELSESP